MNVHLRTAYGVVLTLSTSVLLLSWCLPGAVEFIALPFFVLVMVTTGLPHGATDHLIDRFRQEKQGRPFVWSRFLAVYLGAMLLYGLAWMLLPLLSLALFILISAYHFGQSQLLYLREDESHPLKWGLYLSWGLTVLTAIIGLNPGESGDVLAALLPHEQWQALNGVWSPLLMGSAGLTVLLLTYAWLSRRMSLRAYALEGLNLLLLGLIAWQANLLVSFAVYFGLWHSVASISTEINILQRENPGFDWRAFARAALPFSLISFLGIGILLAAGYFFGSLISPYLLFFMAISVLTLPHMVFMQGFYHHGQRLLPDFQ